MLIKGWSFTRSDLMWRCDCVSRFVKSSRLPAKISVYLVGIGRLPYLAFLYEWRFLNKIFLDWPLSLTTHPSTAKLSDNPGTDTFIVTRGNPWPPELDDNPIFKERGIL